MRKCFRYSILFCVFGAIYYILETIYKGYWTHWTMFILSGFIGIMIGCINEVFPWDLSFWIQCGIGMIIATSLEGVSGLILNVWLHLGVWDYSNTPMHFFFQQCCIPFCLVWFILSGVCILLDDYMRWRFFGEEYPRYNFNLW